MKRSILFAASLSLFAAAPGCNVDEGSDVQAEPVAVEQQEIVTGAVGPLFWPTAPIMWDGGIGTWSIGLWADMPINWLALDIPGAKLLGFDLVDSTGAILASSTAIDAALLDTIGVGSWMGGLWPTYAMLPWLNGIATTSFFGVPSYVYGLGYYPFVGDLALTGATLGTAGLGLGLDSALIGGLAFPGLMPAGFAATGLGTTLVPSAAFLSPSLTANALMLNTLPLLGTSPLFLNVRFSGINASMRTSLNIVSSFSAAQSAAIQATLFPIMGIPAIL